MLSFPWLLLLLLLPSLALPLLAPQERDDRLGGLQLLVFREAPLAQALAQQGRHALTRLLERAPARRRLGLEHSQAARLDAGTTRARDGRNSAATDRSGAHPPVRACV